MAIIKYASPVGALDLHFSETALTGLYFNSAGADVTVCPPIGMTKIIEQTITELNEYFNGTRREFTIPVEAHGTEFRKTVWERLLHVPFGTTKSYMDIAKEIGNPKSPRAVGGAVGKNPISIIIPCHRIIGTSGSLTGFGGGLPIKEWLLRHEGII